MLINTSVILLLTYSYTFIMAFWGAGLDGQLIKATRLEEIARK